MIARTTGVQTVVMNGNACMLAVVRRYSMTTPRYRCCSHCGYGDGCTDR